jgi:conjugative transfer signal peptidase TraF
MAVVPIALLFAIHAHVCINWTESLPRGLYWYDPTQIPKMRRGDLVLTCPPESVALLGRERGYLPPGYCTGGTLPLLKILVALPGDTVDIRTSGEWIDGKLLPSSARIERDKDGRTLATIAPGRYTLSADACWLYSPAWHSWDSRYFGATRSHMIIGIAHPLLVFGSRFPLTIAEQLRS